MIKWLVAWLCMVSFTVWAGDDYRVGVGDVVKVMVYDHQDLTTEVALGTDGMMTFPMLGEVKLEGLTSTQAEALLAKKLLDGGFIKHPDVNVMVTQYRSKRVSVIGEVYKPGRYALDGPTSLLDMLATAGGISPTGGDAVVLIHNGKRTEIIVPKIMASADSAQATTLVSNGDILFVPRLPQVYVYGEVNRPGAFRLEQNMSVMQSLSLAGGFTLRASHSRIQIHRSDANGAVSKMPAKLTDLLQANDVVFVDESIF